MDPRRPVDELERIGYEIRRLHDRIDELATPSGTSKYQTVAKLQLLVSNIQQQLDDYIANGTYNKAQINAMRGSSPAGFTANGPLQVNGAATATGRGTFTGGVTSADVRSRVVTVGYVAQYIDSSGVMGYAPSTLESKSLHGRYEVDLETWLELGAWLFHYKDDPTQEKRAGFIAQLVESRFPEWCIYGPDGDLQGVRYEQMMVGLHSAFVQHVAETRTQHADLVARIEALETP